MSLDGKKLPEEMRRKISESRIKSLKENPHVKWYKVSNGSKFITVQGKWEKMVAEWLTQNSIKWDRKAIKYNDTRTYTPDFYLIDLDEYVEVKGWWKERDKYKMFLVINEYPDCKIRILDKRHIEKLENLTINNLPFFIDEFKIEEINFSQFKNVWGKDCSCGEIGETPRT